MSSFHLPSAGEWKVGNGCVALCFYVITVASTRTESSQQHKIFTPRGAQPMTTMEYSMNLAYIVSYIFSSRLIPYWGQTFFKKLFFRKTDCCNIAVSSTSRRTVVALGKELRRLWFLKTAAGILYIERTKPTCPTTVFFFSAAGQIRFKYFRITAEGYLLFSNLPNIFFE